MELAEPTMLLEHVGDAVGVGTVTVTQEMIDEFAHATLDEQWIHVDVERARNGPYGATIAHGFLTLSLIPHFLDQVVTVRRIDATLNYGVERVRFPAPVISDTLLHAEVVLTEATPVAGGIQVRYQVTVTSEGTPKPHCVCVVIVRYLFTTQHDDAQPRAASEEATA